MSNKTDIQLSVPRVDDDKVNIVISRIVDAVNTLMVDKKEMAKAISRDARRKHTVEPKLDTIGTIRIKSLGKNTWTLEIRTEKGWKEAVIDGANLRFE